MEMLSHKATVVKGFVLDYFRGCLDGCEAWCPTCEDYHEDYCECDDHHGRPFEVSYDFVADTVLQTILPFKGLTLKVLDEIS